MCHTGYYWGPSPSQSRLFTTLVIVVELVESFSRIVVFAGKKLLVGTLRLVMKPKP